MNPTCSNEPLPTHLSECKPGSEFKGEGKKKTSDFPLLHRNLRRKMKRMVDNHHNQLALITVDPKNKRTIFAILDSKVHNLMIDEGWIIGVNLDKKKIHEAAKKQQGQIKDIRKKVIETENPE